ncbi:MAG: element excision factor XisH family protein, partial [Pseudanabaena sp.]
MPARDSIHETVKEAVIKDGWEITDDPYVKAIRWASDRIGDEGVVAFVTNNSFIDGIAFDGMRQYLE